MAAKTIKIPLPDEAATLSLGRRLGALLQDGDIVFLRGDLGAGKSTLARGVIRSHIPDAEAPSPTFTFVEIYETAQIALYHYDFYRLETPQDVWELGLEEALERGVILAEWPERITPIPGIEPLEVTLDIKGGARLALIKAQENWAARLTDAGIGSEIPNDE